MEEPCRKYLCSIISNFIKLEIIVLKSFKLFITLENIHSSTSCGTLTICLQMLWFDSYTFPRTPTHSPMKFREGQRKTIHATLSPQAGHCPETPCCPSLVFFGVCLYYKVFTFGSSNPLTMRPAQTHPLSRSPVCIPPLPLRCPCQGVSPHLSLLPRKTQPHWMCSECQ